MVKPGFNSDHPDPGLSADQKVELVNFHPSAILEIIVSVNKTQDVFQHHEHWCWINEVRNASVERSLIYSFNPLALFRQIAKVDWLQV